MSALPRGKFFTEEQLGSKQSLTPEGFLLCRDVPIARIGPQYYADGEIVGISSNGRGVIVAERHAEDVFDDKTVRSFEGKSVTDNHPLEFINPDNWRDHEIGQVHNVRRGDGRQNDLLIADLLIKHRQSIADVKAGKREVSCGYDADYAHVSPGRVRQVNIIGNHVALVPKGRCGARCAIGDAAMAVPGSNKTIAWKDRVRIAYLTKDNDELEAALEAAGEAVIEAQEAVAEAVGEQAEVIVEAAAVAQEEAAEASAAASEAISEAVEANERAETLAVAAEAVQVDPLAEIMAMLSTLAADVAMLKGAPSVTEAVAVVDAATPAVKVTDAASDWSDTVARAEILVPGIRLPTMDAKPTGKQMTDAACALRKAAVRQAYDGKHGPFLKLLNGGTEPDFTSLTCDKAKHLFIAASQVAMDTNRQVLAAGLAAHVTAPTAGTQKPRTNAEINRKNREHFAPKKPS